MKLCKRSISILLLLCFLVSLFLPTVNAATGTLGRNTASRHITCTSLSSQAQAYYTAGTYDYATISAMHGVYSTDSWTVTQNNPVYTNLQQLMVNTHTNTSVVYSGTANGSLAYYWNYTDTVNSGSNYLLFYCDKLMSQVQNTEGYGRTGMEREHVWCKSKADYVEDSNSGGADLHHMRPSYGYINGIKSNRSFGNVTNGTACTLDGVSVFTYASNTETGVMEVNDNIKGDIARILLYVYVRWGQPNLYTSYGSNISQKLKTAGVNTSGTINGSDDGTKIIDDLDTLLEWMEIDPVDTWEMQRNDQIENVQGNRNVFIDYPEYAWIMFGMADQMPTDMDTPSGMAKQGASAVSYRITNVNVNNNSFGSAVITDSKTVTVTPAANYYLQSATATSGNVAINGNTITVSNMTADTTVNVIFARLPQYTVSYSVSGTVSSSVTCNQGDSITLPDTAASAAGYTFIGWTTAAVATEVTTMPVILTGSYTPMADITLYAVYRRVEGNQNPKPAGYSLTSQAPEAGTNVIIARQVNGSYYALTTSRNPSSTLLTIENDVVTNTNNVTWSVSAATSGVYLKPSTGSNYLHMNSNALQVTNNTDNADIVFTSNGDGSYKATRSDGNRYIVTNGTNGFGCSQNSGSAAKLYIFRYHDGEASSTAYFTTNPACPHTNKVISGAYDATCTEDGYTGNTVCANCGKVFSSGTAIPATGHTVVTDAAVNATCTTAGKTEGSHCSVCDAVITAQATIPVTGHNFGAATNSNNASYHTFTCQNAGCGYSYTESHDFAVTTSGSTKTYTCKACGYSYSSKLNNYTVTYNDCGTTSSVNVIEGNSVTPPAAASTIEGYTFVGWSFVQTPVEATSVTLQTEAFTPTANTTLYAVYSREATGTGEATYTLVTNANQLQSGKKVIIAAKDYDTAMGAPLNTYYRAQASVTKSGNTLTPSDGVYYFTLGNPTSGIWTLWDESSSAYLTAYVSGKYYDLGTETTLSDNGRFTLNISSDGTAAISTNSGYCNVRYVTGSYVEFACKSSATDGYDCALYIETPGTTQTTYYTSSPAVSENYTVSFNVLGAVSSRESVSAGNSITLPDTTAAVDGYTFVGWADGTIDPESTAATVLTGSYTPAASVTLYAVYSRTESGDGAPASLVRMNAGDTLSAGDKLVIVANGTDYIMYQQTQSGSYVANKTGGSSISVSTVADDRYYFDVSGSEGSWVLGDAVNGYLYTNTTNNLAVSKEDSSAWVLTDNEDDTFSLLTGGRYLSCRTDLTTGNANLFRLGGTGGSGTTKLDLYKYTPGAVATVYYTTNPTGAAPCTHTNTHLENAAAATCTTAGYTGDTVCNDCGETVSFGTTIAALGHTVVTDAAIAATCTTAGKTEGSHCSVCNTVLVAQQTVAALGHSYNGGIVTTPATCTSAGIKTFTCSRCDASYTEAITALGHDYNTNGICTRCNDELIKITSAALRLDEDIDVIYTAKIPEGASAFMTFTMNGQSVTVADDGTHAFSFEAVNPQCMGDNISATLTVIYNSNTYTCSKENYSVRQYCVNKLADSSVTGKLRTLISDVLAYGAAAQTYMNYNNSALVNVGEDIASPLYSTFTSLSGFAPSFNGTAASDVRWVAAGLTLTDSVAMTFRFYADSIEGLTVTVAINGRTQTFTESDFAPVEGKANTYEISFKGIKATEFASDVTASFARNDATVGNTVSYSVNTYVCAKQADGNTALANLVKALYNYGASAAAYTE